MPTVTKVNIPKKSPKKRAVYLDGAWAFNINATIVEKRGLRVGVEISAADVEAIKGAEVRQKALDKGLSILSRRLHSVSEVRTKLVRAKYTSEQVEHAVSELTRLGYLDDARFAKAKAASAAKYRKHGERRAYVELIKSGVQRETARRASVEVYEAHDSMKVARELAAKKLPSLRRLDKATAQRRLTGMLLRRGFNFDEIRPVIEETLGTLADEGGGE